MTKIKKYVEHMEDELAGAKMYAEQYVDYKVKGDSQTASKMLDASKQEYNHAMLWHDIAAKEIDAMSKVITPPPEMMEKWEHEHKEYVKSAAEIKMMWTL